VHAFNAAVRAADPGLYPSVKSWTDPTAVAVSASAWALTLLLAAVAGLGVLNTAVLTVRERRRDLGVLRSVGMTPRQVTLATVTAMAGLGAAGGLLGVPVGVAAHALAVPAMAGAAGVVLPGAMLDVWHVPGLVLPVLAGVAIAALGAFVPARAAGRTTIARVLHNE
jgi:putative ABC transport system permease protein